MRALRENDVFDPQKKLQRMHKVRSAWDCTATTVWLVAMIWLCRPLEFIERVLKRDSIYQSAWLTRALTQIILLIRITT